MIHLVHDKITQGNGEKFLSKFTETLSKQRWRQGWMQSSCSCALDHQGIALLSPNLHVHLDLAFLARVLGVLDVLEVFLVESERKAERMVVAVEGWGWNGRWWCGMDGMDAVVVWWWLYTPFSSLGGVVRAGGEVEPSPFPLSWGAHGVFPTFALFSFKPSLLSKLISFPSLRFKLIWIAPHLLMGPCAATLCLIWSCWSWPSSFLKKMCTLHIELQKMDNLHCKCV